MHWYSYRDFPSPEHWNWNTDEGIEAMLARSWSTRRSHTDSLWESWG